MKLFGKSIGQEHEAQPEVKRLAEKEEVTRTAKPHLYRRKSEIERLTEKEKKMAAKEGNEHSGTFAKFKAGKIKTQQDLLKKEKAGQEPVQ
jgi:hypothetical protein